MNHGCADRDNVFLIPFRITILQEHEDREKYIEPEFEDLKVRSSHRGCGSRGIAPEGLDGWALPITYPQS